MDKRTLYAVVLAIFVMVSYSYVIQKFYPAPKESPVQINKTETVSSTISNVSQPLAPSTFDSAILLPSETRVLSTDNVTYEFSDMGGCLKSIKIKKYNGLEQKEPEHIYDAKFSQDAIFSIVGIGEEGDLSKTKYNFSKTSNSFEYTTVLKNKLEIKKIFSLQQENGLAAEIVISNASGALQKINYSMVGASNMKSSTAIDKRFIETMVFIKGKQKKIRGVSANKQNNIYTGNIDLLSMQGKYFTLVMKPYQPTVSLTVSKNIDNDIYSVIQSDTIEVPSGSSVSSKFLLYSGPVNYTLMSGYGAGIEKSINMGIFSDISNILLSSLKFLYKLTHNYGVAIILLALIISILLYPLTLKSVKSMKQMQLIQPKMDKLRKELKDNPQKLNKEIMELYKKNKVNPFGGCLPMLLQMPIFIALYQAFMRAIELKNAKFLWISDLSTPDRAFSLFSGGFSVNILPILMAITMFFQQKMSIPASSSTAGAEDSVQQQQKMMLVLMPVLFGFIFYNMPSGLVLYWFINTLIMFFQQVKVSKQFHVENAIV